MRFHVPNTHVLIVGDFNAHVSDCHSKGGTPLPCGEVHDEALGLTFEGKNGTTLTYMVQRHSQSTVQVTNAHISRGTAVNRACKTHGLLMLNGRAQSSRHGAFTHRDFPPTGDSRSVLDLAIVPREATADLRMVTVQQGGQARAYHQMLLTTIAGSEVPENGEAWGSDSRWVSPPNTSIAQHREPEAVQPLVPPPRGVENELASGQ